MTCWDVLEKRAKTERDKAVEAISEVRSRLEEQQMLCERVQKIAEQYQEKIKAPKGRPGTSAISSYTEHPSRICSTPWVPSVGRLRCWS